MAESSETVDSSQLKVEEMKRRCALVVDSRLMLPLLPLTTDH